MPALWIYLNSQMSLINEIVFFPLCRILKVLVITCFEDRNCFGLCTYVQFFCAEFIKKISEV